MPQCVADAPQLRDTAIHCHTPQHTATRCVGDAAQLQDTAAHCNTAQHTATRCVGDAAQLQDTATHCNTSQHIATRCAGDAAHGAEARSEEAERGDKFVATAHEDNFIVQEYITNPLLVKVNIL